MKTKLKSSMKGKGGLHVKGKAGSKYTIGARDTGGPAKKGGRIVLGSGNKGTSNLMGSTK